MMGGSGSMDNDTKRDLAEMLADVDMILKQ